MLEKLEVPRIQFLDRLLDIPVARPFLARQWIHILRLSGCFLKNFTHFLRECGTLILKSILRSALHWPTVEVCTGNASIAEQLHMEIWTVFRMSPLYLADFLSCRQTPLVEFLEPSTTKRSSSSRAREVAGSLGVSTPR